ncbi:peptidoglycan-binding protein [Streptomyces gelaticus]|uniref:peptidoglycan-binding protein n=1 Tax=Streptomyces gelaticus TaxID=285446 RepID=UPI0037A3878E
MRSTKQNERNNMPDDSRERKAGVGVVRATIATAATVLLTAGVLAPATAAASPASTSVVSASTTSQHVAPSTDIDVQSRCLVWRRTTANYAGLTAGYSWAWNVYLGAGDSGDRVREVQCLLDWWGYYGDPLDGRYGPVTSTAVENFQWDHCGGSVVEYGIVDPATWRCLRDGGEV